jgi:hypothetical protein
MSQLVRQNLFKTKQLIDSAMAPQLAIRSELLQI